MHKDCTVAAKAGDRNGKKENQEKGRESGNK